MRVNTNLLFRSAVAFLAIGTIAGAVFLGYDEGHAETIDDFKKMIEEKNTQILALEEEAAKFKEGLADTQERGKTILQEIARIRGSIQKLERDIAITEGKLMRAELEIEKAAFEINEKQSSITKLHEGLAGLVRIVFEADRESPLFVLLASPTISQGLKYVDYGIQLKRRIVDTLDMLRSSKEALVAKKSEEEARQREAGTLKLQLDARERALEGDEKEHATLLSLTREQASVYQKILDEQEKKRELLQEEIREIEAKIRITIDPASLPPKGRGVIGPPLADTGLESCWQKGVSKEHCVTQFFGDTDFAKSGGYNGKGHNGVDFRADIGAPVYAVGSGVVEAMGDTDIGCRGASYGKWILVRHQNNLSSLYAHLSYIGVVQGQAIERGTQIGLTGKSGYATGPHLHLGIFATQAVEIVELRSRVCGRMMTLPVAAVNGYLDPLDYL